VALTGVISVTYYLAYSVGWVDFRPRILQVYRLTESRIMQLKK